MQINYSGPLKRMMELGVGHIRIGVSTVLCKYVLLPCLKEFVARYPHVKFTIHCQSTLQTLELLEKQQIDLVIKLEDWKKEAEYDRLGLEEEYAEYLGNKVVCHSLPIRPGRNLAVIVETAAVNHRQKKMGYNAAHELYRRVQANLTKNSEE